MKVESRKSKSKVEGLEGRRVEGSNNKGLLGLRSESN